MVRPFCPNRNERTHLECLCSALTEDALNIAMTNDYDDDYISNITNLKDNLDSRDYYGLGTSRQALEFIIATLSSPPDERPSVTKFSCRWYVTSAIYEWISEKLDKWLKSNTFYDNDDAKERHQLRDAIYMLLTDENGNKAQSDDNLENYDQSLRECCDTFAQYGVQELCPVNDLLKYLLYEQDTQLKIGTH